MKMPRVDRRGVASAISAVGVVSLALAAGGDAMLAEKHVRAAQATAGEDLKGALSNCKLVGKPLVIPKDKIHGVLEKFVAMGRFEPARVFDNLYYVGAKWVSAWAIKTPDGIILIDTLNNADEAASTIEKGLRELGLDPASIKKIIVTHAHGDHYGGATYLQEKYSAEIIMSEKDWQEMAKPELQYDDVLWGRPPKRGTSLPDGGSVTLGGYTVKAIQTPGHTPGTLSLVFDVTDNGEAHRVMLWGGNGFNFGQDSERAVSYIDSAHKFRDLAKSSNIDVFLSNHAGLDGTGPKLAALKTRAAGASNPFVIGESAVERTMTTLAECGTAVLAGFDAASVPK
jgi:metallo-beta-lactamase class B